MEKIEISTFIPIFHYSNIPILDIFIDLRSIFKSTFKEKKFCFQAPTYFKISYTKNTGQTQAFKKPNTPIQKLPATEM